MPRSATSKPRQATKPAGGITFTTVTASVSYADALPRFVRATQILMIGAERRRAAEVAAESEVAK